MKIQFNISYFTRWGQTVYVLGSLPELGANSREAARPMHFSPSETWTLEMDIAVPADGTFSYCYFVKDETSSLVEYEWGNPHVVTLDKKHQTIRFVDAWRSPGAFENIFLSAPYRDVLLRHKTYDAPQTVGTHIFYVQAPLLNENEVLGIVGECASLGNWSTDEPHLMSRLENAMWMLEIDLKKEKSPIRYKYGIFDAETKHFKRMEMGNDRLVPSAEAKTQTVVHDTFARFDTSSWHGAGVSIPVFSLRSERSFGAGDFTDLAAMADWASSVGLKMIQVLPLNDTVGTHSNTDVLPYAAISAFALNPLFLDLEKIGKLDDSDPLRQAFAAKREALNALPLMDYLEVINYKLAYIKQAYLAQKENFLNDSGFKKYFEENRYWLSAYAVYCSLRDHLGTNDYRQWGEYACYDESQIALMSQPSHEWFDDVAVNWFAQYHLHLQLKLAVDHAHKKGVIIKGDVPIGVNKNSVDTWVAPELFHMDMNAGAPPDMFAVKGQNWELPTYNWEVIERSDYDWWKKRFRQMENYFDAFRIDHILGFFRIWQIPTAEVEGIMGHLSPSVPLYVDEFEKRGVWFDYERFCVPYITDEIINQTFGHEADWVRNNCLYLAYGFAYRLKPEFATQTQVAACFDRGEISERTKYGLFDLISNVLLFEVKGSEGRQYYPRFGMQTLSTFHALDDKQQKVFDELYVDYFYRRQDARWFELGLKKLTALKQATNMLMCGEDLGMMTHCVTAVMKQLSILSLEVQRAPKIDSREFFHPADAPYLSVVTPSTHDMSTVRGWWEESREVTQQFYNTELGHLGQAPYFCEWWICRDVLLQHLYSPAMWAIFQWQDLMGISEQHRRENPNDERINVPSNSLYSWRYRMHMTIESLQGLADFNKALKNLITQSGR